MTFLLFPLGWYFTTSQWFISLQSNCISRGVIFLFPMGWIFWPFPRDDNFYPFQFVQNPKKHVWRSGQDLDLEIRNVGCIGSKIKKLNYFHSTMLQKLSKCEVKVWLCWNLIILPPLRCYMKSHFGEFKCSKNVVFGNLRGFKYQIYQILKFRVTKIAKNDIFGLFEFAKIRFYVKSEWW